MELLYPGYKGYVEKIRTQPFQTEYTTRYCQSTSPVLYGQTPKYTWYEPRRPTVIKRRYDVENAFQLTHLRPPFAARMTSYEPDVGDKGRATVTEDAPSARRVPDMATEQARTLKFPDVYAKFGNTTASKCSREELKHAVEERVSPRLSSRKSNRDAPNAATPAFYAFEKRSPDLEERVSSCKSQSDRNAFTSSAPQLKEPSSRSSLQFKPKAVGRSTALNQSPLSSRTGSSISTHAQQVAKRSRAQEFEARQASASGTRAAQAQRVAPRPNSLLSKHAKDVNYVRDTCFFQPAHVTKKHYYVVNPNWFSEKHVTIHKNNVFS